jgi:AcrR family transcriptional regulator
MRRVNPKKHEEKRRDILAAAKKCFARSGFEGASIAEICKAAKISPGHLYHYFKSKEAIVEALAEDALAEGAENLRQLVEQMGAFAALNTVIESARGSQLRKNFSMLLELVLAAGRNPKLAKMLKAQTRRTRLTLAEMLRAGQAAGLIDPSLDAEAVAGLLFALLDGMRVQLSRDPALDFDALRDHLKIMVGRFLAARPHQVSVKN